MKNTEKTPKNNENQSKSSQEEVLLIEASNLADFLGKILEATSQGYKLNLERNDTYPVHFGFYFKVIMVR